MESLQHQIFSLKYQVIRVQEAKGREEEDQWREQADSTSIELLKLLDATPINLVGLITFCLPTSLI